MNICRDDVEKLKAPEWIIDYLSRKETPRGMTNGKYCFTCCLHAHKHPDKPHLRVEARGGVGVAVCDSYGVIGDIFATAQAYGDGGGSFPETVRAVADAVGYRLRGDDGTRRCRRRQTRRRFTPTRPQELAERADAGRAGFLSPDEEKAALEAVRRLHENPAAIARHAAGLNVPEIVIIYHSDLKEPGTLGLLGEDERGHLLHLYTYRDEAGRLRVRYTKTRLKPYNPDAAAVSMPYFTTPKSGVNVELWGVDELRHEDCRRVIITEGESDCLAVRAAVWSWLDWWAHDEEHLATFPPPESWPLVLAKPGAGGFKPEWLRTEWGRKLLRADVILVRDNDEAGRVGAEKTAGMLQAAGARRVFVWCPPDGVKDAREALDPARPWFARPWLLAEDIMRNKRQFQP